MTEQLADISSRLATVRQLDAVVGAMRGMAGARAQQGRNLLPAIRAYAGIVARSMAQALRLLPDVAEAPPAAGPEALIVFAAEQGFVGTYGERIVDALAAERGNAELFVVGSRGAALAADRGLRAVWAAPMASHAGGLARLSRRLGDALYDGIRDRGLARVRMLLPQWMPQGGLQIERRLLLPLDLAHFRQPSAGMPPLVNLPVADLVEGLVEEYVHTLLHEAVAIAFAAENEARVAAMASARNHIQHMLDELRARERQVRQDSITAEVIELATGTAALRSSL